MFIINQINMPTVNLYLSEDEYYYAELIGKKRGWTIKQVLIIGLNNLKVADIDKYAETSTTTRP